ncbi:cupin domain-containing protein [Bacillus licheniformis]
MHESEPHHGGIEEYVLVSKGAIAVTAGDYTCDLNEGDAMHFTANTVHTYENNTEQTASCYTLIYYP